MESSEELLWSVTCFHDNGTGFKGLIRKGPGAFFILLACLAKDILQEGCHSCSSSKDHFAFLLVVQDCASNVQTTASFDNIASQVFCLLFFLLNLYLLLLSNMWIFFPSLLFRQLTNPRLWCHILSQIDCIPIYLLGEIRTLYTINVFMQL